MNFIHRSFTLIVVSAFAVVIHLVLVVAVTSAQSPVDVCQRAGDPGRPDYAICVQELEEDFLNCDRAISIDRTKCKQDAIDSYFTPTQDLEEVQERVAEEENTRFGGGTATLQVDCEPPDGQALSAENCGIISYLVIAINFLSAVAGMAIIASIMIAGYQYMTARDNSGQVEAAKKRIVMALIALALFIFGYAILNFLVPGGVL